MAEDSDLRMASVDGSERETGQEWAKKSSLLGQEEGEYVLRNLVLGRPKRCWSLCARCVIVELYLGCSPEVGLQAG